VTRIHQIEKMRHCEPLIVGCLAIGVKRAVVTIGGTPCAEPQDCLR
jgi:hypothetical protein